MTQEPCACQKLLVSPNTAEYIKTTTHVNHWIRNLQILLNGLDQPGC